MYRKLILMLIASTMIMGMAFAQEDDVINKTKADYNPTVLPDNPLYPFKIAYENWVIDHQYLILPDDNQTSKTEKRMAFIERRIVDTNLMIQRGVNIHAVNNSIEHMQIALMALNGSTKEEIKAFRKEVNDIQKEADDNRINGDISHDLNDTKDILDEKEVEALEHEVEDAEHDAESPSTLEISQHRAEALREAQDELAKKLMEIEIESTQRGNQKNR